MSKIKYVKISSDKTIYPDNPKYDFPKGVSDIGQKTTHWFNMIKEEFENFEHHKNSSIFSVYGHTSENPTLKMPSGGVPMSERYNNMVEDVADGCRYRIENYLNEQIGGWKVFEKLLGDYEVEIIDNEVIEERLVILNKFTELLNKDDYLTSIDPNTNENAKTTIDPLTEQEKGIEYLFPYGIENTDELHYSVLELPKPEREEVKEEDIDRFIRKIIFERIISSERPANPKILGFILGNYPELRPYAAIIKEKLTEAVLKINTSYPDIISDAGIGEYSLEKALEDEELSNIKDIYLRHLAKELESYEDIAKMKELKNEGTYEEVFKTISIKKIINRCQDEVIKNQLMKFKPPAAGKGGGSSWPKSRGGKYVLRFSQNPVDMLTKTTGRAWGSKDWSCENWDGQWLKGPQSDFKYGNCVVWVFNAGKLEHNQQIGRAILRWGDSYDELGNNLNKKDVGLEQQLYPKDAAWGLNMFKAIAQILSDTGYFKYNQLNTPYRYDGYSDYIGRGGCNIQYNKPKFKGKNIELGENELMAMASNVKLAYATAGWLVSNGNEMVKRTLSQNPVIWMYETPTRRLINASLDLDDGKGLIYDLICSDYVDFNFMNVVIDTISLYDPEYDMWGNAENFTSVILNHPNADVITHNKLLDTHPGFKELGTLIELGTIEELIYFDILNRANRIDTYLNRNISLAPMEILDDAIDKLFAGKLLNNPKTKENRWSYAVNYNYIEAGYTNNEDKKFYKNYRELLYAINNLILSPNLSNKSYCKLLKLFQDIDVEKSNLVSSGDLDATSLSCKLVESVRTKIAMVSCFPFNTSNSWGWTWDDYIDNTGMDREYKLNIIPLKKKDRYFKQPRQSPKSIDLLLDICPEMFLIKDKSGRQMFNFDSSGNSSLLTNKSIIFYNHIQSQDVSDYLYKKHIRWGIDPLNLLLKTIPEELDLNVESAIDDILNSGVKLECKLSVKNQSKVIKNFISNIDLEDKVNYEDTPIKKDFLPYSDIFTENLIFQPLPRNSAPKDFIKHLLASSDADKLIVQLGVDLIGRWLEEESDFYKFERTLYKAIFGKYYKYENKTHKFTPLPPQPDMSMKDLDVLYKIMEDIENMKSEIDISLLTVCANGLETYSKGLASNPNLPESMQLRLILPEFDAETGKKITAFGNTKWSILSERYDGDYNYYKSSIVEQMASNKGASGPTLRYLMKNYYPTAGGQILLNIAKNPNSWLVGEQEYQKLVDNHPIELLTNKEQGLENIRELFWDKIMPVIMTKVRKDPQEQFNMQICDLSGNKQKYGLGTLINDLLSMADSGADRWDARMLHKIEQTVSKASTKDYLELWRGGSWDKPLHRGSVTKINNWPMSGIRSSPVNTKVKSIERRSYSSRQGFTVSEGKKKGNYELRWPYEHIQSHTNFIDNITKPQFIVTFEDGCFTYLPQKQYEMNNANSVIKKLGIVSRNAIGLGFYDKVGSAKKYDSIEELKRVFEEYTTSYTIPDVVNITETWKTRELAETYLRENYGVDPEREGKPASIIYADKITRINELPIIKGILESDAYKNPDLAKSNQIFREVQTHTDAVRDPTVMLYEVQEVIKTENKRPTELARMLNSKFGVDLTDMDLEGEELDYKYLGRKKRIGGKWVKFSYNSMQFMDEVGYTSDGWKKDMVLGFVSKKRDTSIPDWRLEMTTAKLKTMVRNYIKNPITTHEDYLLIYDMVETNNNLPKSKSGKVYTSPIGDYNFRMSDLFNVINRHKLWTRDIINDSLSYLTNPNGNSFINNYNSAKPTSKLLELTMIDSRDALEALGYINLRVRDVKFIQEWIVNNFSKDLPISYVYELISYPGASEQVKAMVRNIRNIRLDEFIDYQRQLQDEMLEANAEEYSAENVEINLDKNLSKYNQLVEEYCNFKYPKDLNKRRALMENIIYGKKYIPINELQRMVGE